MVMTVTLARGALRMAKQKVVVKRLTAIHDLGAMSVLCTDKTGTLTEARIALLGSLAPAGGDCPEAIALARLNSRFATTMPSNLDTALLADAREPEAGTTLVDEVPFDFERRRSAVLVDRAGARQLIVKGAPEGVIACCTQVAQPNGTAVPLDDERRQALEGLIEAEGRKGLRLIAVARKPMPADRRVADVEDETGLTLVGCATFVDPPKPSATTAVKRLAAAGVRLKIISGDAGPVVTHLVETLKIEARGILSGDEIATMSDAALAARVNEVDLYVRVSPDQKRRIVLALRHRGATVGYMGDGINDAPAIHAADVGLSVDTGTEVARQAADIVLLAPDLGALVDGVAEGRRTYANIMKYVRMGTSSNFGNMLSMALASLVVPFLPLLPLQILLNNLLYDLSEIGIPFDGADREDLARPHGWEMRSVLRFTLIMGPLSSLFDIATFALLLLVFHAQPEVFRTAWFVESIATQVLVIFVIRTSRPVWASRPHATLIATSLGALAAAVALALTPLGAIADFAPVPPAILATIVAIGVLYLAAAEALKRFAMRPSAGGR
jgi:Mg2+-importing ATPase